MMSDPNHLQFVSLIHWLSRALLPKLWAQSYKIPDKNSGDSPFLNLLKVPQISVTYTKVIETVILTTFWNTMQLREQITCSVLQRLLQTKQTDNKGMFMKHSWKELVVLRLNVPVNNFSVMSGRSHRFLGN